MLVSHFILLVEELSMEAFLRAREKHPPQARVPAGQAGEGHSVP